MEYVVLTVAYNRPHVTGPLYTKMLATNRRSWAMRCKSVCDQSPQLGHKMQKNLRPIAATSPQRHHKSERKHKDGFDNNCTFLFIASFLVTTFLAEWECCETFPFEVLGRHHSPRQYE